MTVIELIIKLQKFPPNMEVLHVTSTGTMFKFQDIDSVDQIEVGDDDTPVCALSSEGVIEEPNDN